MNVLTRNTEQQSNTLAGIAPSDLRARNAATNGLDAKTYFAIGSSLLGPVLVARSEPGICAILIGDDPSLLARDLQDRFPRADLVDGDGDCQKLVAKVASFIECPALGLALSLDIRGTAFQKRVWQALRQIPVGATVSVCTGRGPGLRCERFGSCHPMPPGCTK